MDDDCKFDDGVIKQLFEVGVSFIPLTFLLMYSNAVTTQLIDYRCEDKNISWRVKRRHWCL
jgi:hypothetical protein